MKLVGTDGNTFFFQLSRREKRLLFEVLRLYPIIPTAHHRLSKTARPIETDQKLLEDALAERKRQHKRQLLALLADERRFSETEEGCRFTATGPQIDWLLQVLNDIRVGSWLILGEPDESKGKPPKVTHHNAAHYAAMEFCGYFQMSLLEAFNGQT